MAKKSGSGPLQLGYAVKSFLGHLEGTQKASLTVESYKSDLGTFQRFLQGKGRDRIAVGSLEARHLRSYSQHLLAAGLKTNTRRRKLLTVRKFLRYLTQRKKLNFDPSHQLPTPYKLEKIPRTVDSKILLEKVRDLSHQELLPRRNRLLLWVLVETGCLVSEVCGTQFEDFRKGPTGPEMAIGGKNPRAVPVSPTLWQEVLALRAVSSGRAYLFSGFNRFGPLSAKMTPRGVELLIKHYSRELGFSELTPRTIRHSAVVHWFRQGITQKDIQTRLGLKTDYAFRVYQPIFRQIETGGEG